MKIGVIGFGNLGEALVKGVLSQKIIDKDSIYICAKSESTLNKAIKEYGVNASSDINEVILNRDIIIFVIKEKVFLDIAQSINIKMLEEKIVVSFMAGVSIEKMQKFLGKNINVIRAMPSIAIADGNGIIGYTKTTKYTKYIVNQIFKKLGNVILIDEIDIEKITALSACGLGFAAYIMNCFVKAGVQLGFNKSISEKIITQTFTNVIQMSDYSQIVHKVATKGGATEKGIESFEQNEVQKIVYEAFEKAYKKVK